MKFKAGDIVVIIQPKNGSQINPFWLGRRGEIIKKLHGETWLIQSRGYQIEVEEQELRKLTKLEKALQ